jgi:2-amino-4-hydroxy-6-hydroxymethyldihydropteridine diphosphokinase
MKAAGPARPQTAEPSWVFIALGSNLGDSSTLVRRAVAELGRLSEHGLLESSLWETDPIDCPPNSPPFINAVVGLIPRPLETPESLLAQLQTLERQFGRRPKTVLNEPRPLDLDLIAFGDLRRASLELILPHPRAHLRRFVLEPLAEIAPEFVLTGQVRTVQQLLQALPPDQHVRKVSS